MPVLSFTDPTLRSLQPQAAQVTYWDKNLKNFGVRVSPGGTMTWLLMVGRERRRIKIGTYPVISLKAARDEARRLLAQRTLGQLAPQSLLFKDALDEFEASHLSTLRPKSAYETRRLLRKHFLPPFKFTALDKLAAHDITRITDKLSTSIASHATVAINTFFTWAVGRHYLSASPLLGMKKPQKSKARARVLSDEELKSLWKSCSDEENDLHQHFRAIVKLLILTGQRRGEIAGLRTSYLDGSIATIPAEAVKNHREHSFPLGALVLDLLRYVDLAQEANDVLFFPARGKPTKPFNSWSKSKAALDKLSGVTGWTLHDIRRTVATRMAELGVMPHVIERILNHVSGQISGVAAVYNRAAYQKEMAAAFEVWEAHLQKVLARSL